MTFWQDMMNFFSYDNLMYWLSEYRNLGPLLAFLLPFIEAFFTIFTIYSFRCSERKCIWTTHWLFNLCYCSHCW